MMQMKKRSKKNPGTCGLVKKTDYNTKITEIEVKIPIIIGLAANAALTAVENKLPNVSNLVKKQILMQKLLIIIMINILQLQSLIL